MTEFHADDYGLFVGQSKRILKCYTEGILNGTSVFPNGEELEACLAMLPAEGIALTIHLNLLQGHCLAEKEQVLLLTDRNGLFRISFIKLLICGLTTKRNIYKEQLKSELSAQIHKMLPVFQMFGQELRVDGHAHWHMLPVVFDALMEIIQEEDLPICYIRIPSEPIRLYLHNLRKILPFPIINIVKMIVLKILAHRNTRRWEKELSGMRQKLFLGVLLSGCFEKRKLNAILPEAEKMAERCGKDLEILAHPGAVLEPEDIKRITNKEDYKFFTNSAREMEASSFLER